MGKGKTTVVIKKIIENLKEYPKSITEISNKTGMDRSTITRYIKVLRDTNFIKEQKDGRSKKYIINKEYSNDNYFNLPLNNDINKLVNSIYYSIKKIWKKETNRLLSKTTAQKIMFHVIKKNNLNIPYGFYKFGGTPIKPYDNKCKYSCETNLNSNIIKSIENKVDEYSQNQYTYQDKINHYEEYANELYQLKEKMLSLLYSDKFSKSSLFDFQKQFRNLLNKAPLKEHYSDLLNDYDTLLIDMTQSWDDINNPKRFLTRSFETLWDLIALYQYKLDLKDYYPELLLNENFKSKIESKKEELIMICSKINDDIPKDDLDIDPELKKAIDKIKLRDSENNEDKDIEDIKKEMNF